MRGSPDGPLNLAFFRVAFGGLMIVYSAHVTELAPDMYKQVGARDEAGRLQPDERFSYESRVPDGLHRAARAWPWVSEPDQTAWVVHGMLMSSAAALMALGWGAGSRAGAWCFAVLKLTVTLQDPSLMNNHEYLYGLIGAVLAVSDAHRAEHSLVAHAGAAALAPAAGCEADSGQAAVPGGVPASTGLWIFAAAVAYLGVVDCNWGSIPEWTAPRGVLPLWGAALLGPSLGAAPSGAPSAAAAAAPAWRGFDPWLLKLLVSAVYFYAAVAKLSEDWMSGATISRLLATWSKTPRLAAAAAQLPWWMLPAGGLCVDAVMVVGVWLPPGWLAAAAALVAATFHASNHSLFVLETFPWVMLSTLAVSLPLPLRLGRRIMRVPAAALHMTAALARRPARWCAVASAAVVLGLALLMPMPCALHAVADWERGDQQFGSQCNFFSWRMMTRASTTMPTRLFVTSIGGGAPVRIVSQDKKGESQHEDFAHQAARWAAARDPLCGGSRGKRCSVSLDAFFEVNGPPFQRFIDPTVDLLSVPRPCMHWLHNPAAQPGARPGATDACLLAPENASYVDWWLHAAAALVRATLDKPVPLAPWVRPRLWRYRTPSWRQAYGSIAARARARGRTVFFMADGLDDEQAQGGANAQYIHATVTADGSPAELRVLHGQLAVIEIARASGRTTLGPGQVVHLRAGRVHGLLAVSSSALWYYEGKEVTPAITINREDQGKQAVISIKQEEVVDDETCTGDCRAPPPTQKIS